MDWNELTWKEIEDKAREMRMKIVSGEWAVVNSDETCGCPMTILAAYEVRKEFSSNPDNSVNIICSALERCDENGYEGLSQTEMIGHVLNSTESDIHDFAVTYDHAVDLKWKNENPDSINLAEAAGYRLARSKLGLLPADAKGAAQ